MDVTRVGKLWYLSWMSFSRYSVLCCVPHGILRIQTSTSALVDADLNGRQLALTAWLDSICPSRSGWE